MLTAGHSLGSAAKLSTISKQQLHIVRRNYSNERCKRCRSGGLVRYRVPVPTEAPGSRHTKLAGSDIQSTSDLRNCDGELARG